MVNEDLSTTFFNPFSGKSVRFPPPHPQLIIHPNPAWVNYHSFEKPVLKFVCSSDPNNFESFNGDFVIGAIFGFYDDFAYIKPGSSNSNEDSSGWTHIGSSTIRGGFTDAVNHLGKFYLVDKFCRVISVDVSSTEAKPPNVVPSSQSH